MPEEPSRRRSRSPSRSASRLGPAVLAALTSSCSVGRGPELADGHLRGAGVGAFQDPTVVGARVVPEKVESTASFGVEPNGSSRGLIAGYRVLTNPDGAVLAAEDRFPQAPQVTLAVPQRLGGGFLFLMGSTVFRAEGWLGELRAIHASATAVQRMFLGLDRVYLRTQTGHTAMDPRTGRELDLGPFPQAPQVVSYASVDGWRAAALADLAGLVVTGDAGATWRRVDVGLEPREVSAIGGTLVVSGVEPGRGAARVELRDGGQTVHLASPGKDTPRKLAPPEEQEARPPEARAFGKRPLLAAIEDGWPLTDGAALVARDGALARVRLADGALLEAISNAFPLPVSRCHAVSLERPTAKGAFGFVCGEPRGRTEIYAYDPARGRLVTLKSFTRPRLVLTSGNGALAARGSCAEASEDEPRRGERTYCVLDHGNTWHELHVRGEIGSERLVVLADRRVAIVSPPSGDVVTARLTVLDVNGTGAAKTVPLTFPRIGTDVARALRFGVWLDGFEERRPGVLGGWIDAGGTVLGVEIALDGSVTPGQYLRDAGLPTVSGRYGLGWTQARRLFETTNGGMTWTSAEAPDPLVPLGNVQQRAVGPIGAAAAGWLRVGWGPRPTHEPGSSGKPPEPARARPRITPSLSLSCEALAPTPKIPPPEKPPAPKVAPGAPQPGHISRGGPVVPPWAAPASGYGGARFPQELSSFYGTAAPRLRDSERPMLSVDVHDAFDRAARGTPLAKIYSWGPRTQDPDPSSRWAVRWLWPYDGYAEVRSTAASKLPTLLLDSMRGGLTSGGYTGHYTSTWSVGIGDDSAHSLIAGRTAGRQGLALWELESDRGPVEVRRLDGETFNEIESAVRVGGRWIVSVPATTSPSGATVLFQIDGGIAQELARVPRAATDGRPGQGRLARRADGRAVGFVVEASGPASRGQGERWILSVDLETGRIGEPELAGASDFSDRPLAACAGDETGWVLDMPHSMPVRLRGTSAASGSLSNLLLRVRFTGEKACLDHVAGALVGSSEDRISLVARKGPPRTQAPPGTLRVTAFANAIRYPLACSVVP